MLELYKYIYKFLFSLSDRITEDVIIAVIVLLSLAVMFLMGFGISRLTKLIKLPNVTAYILAGVIIGPLLGLVPGTGAVIEYIKDGETITKEVDIIGKMGFLSDLALGFIAFGVGKFFKKNVIMKAGWRVIVITLMEALLAGVLVTVIVGAIFVPMGKISWSFALLLGAIATATAPASTMMTINQYKAEGDFVNTLLQVVALDDVVCLVVFSIALGVSNGINSANGFQVWNDIFLPLLLNLAFVAAGFLAGLLLTWLVKGRSANSKLIITVALICLISGAGALLNVSPLLSCMMMGAVYINISKDEKVFKYMDHFTPPIMLLFFVKSGMTMDFSAFAVVGIIGVAYFIIRIIGKYFGTYLGCAITKKEKKTKIYLGFALIPQAGVALGLAELGRRSLMGPGTEEAIAAAALFSSIIICSSILYEMAGPVLGKFALVKSGGISEESLKNPSISNKEIVEQSHLYQRPDVSDIEKAQGDNLEARADATLEKEIDEQSLEEASQENENKEE